MTRTQKANNPIHSSTEGSENPLPRNFGKHANHAEGPNRAKKGGAGKANWGRDGDEINDTEEFRIHNARRRSNSKGVLDYMVSKYEIDDEQPAFDDAMLRRVNTSSSTNSEASSEKQ